MKNLHLIKAAKTWSDVDKAITYAVENGILIDKRKEMPRGRSSDGLIKGWRKRKTPADVLGHCLHQNGSQNFTRPKSTAEYHTSKAQHITPGRALPSTCYPIMIPDIDGPAWLTGDLDWITYAQGSKDIGDENRHLIPVLVMGGFEDNTFRRSYTKARPSDHQMQNLLAVVAWLQRVFAYSGEGFFAHSHFGKQACPGRHLRHWTQKVRDVDDRADFLSDLQWQEALMRWNPQALPHSGADGQWGRESRYWLGQFQRAHGLRQTAHQDPFTELMLLQRYPASIEPTVTVEPGDEEGSIKAAIEKVPTDPDPLEEVETPVVSPPRKGKGKRKPKKKPAAPAVKQVVDPEDPPND